MDIDEKTKAEARNCESEGRLDELIRNVRMESARRHADGETKARDDAQNAHLCQKYKIF